MRRSTSKIRHFKRRWTGGRVLLLVEVSEGIPLRSMLVLGAIRKDSAGMLPDVHLYAARARRLDESPIFRESQKSWPGESSDVQNFCVRVIVLETPLRTSVAGPSAPAPVWSGEF